MLRDMTKVRPVRPELSFLSAIAKIYLDQVVQWRCGHNLIIHIHKGMINLVLTHTGCQVGHQGHVEGAYDQGLHPRLSEAGHLNIGGEESQRGGWGRGRALENKMTNLFIVH